ncbi:MAG TPA: protein-disulfide reductase DsbD domain-containing protein [Thermoanaerobaculia bacterium]|nr:protein-disulfide reductase DsbD domain-containing protein [Thermoanaerobaculia bacterium]
MNPSRPPLRTPVFVSLVVLGALGPVSLRAEKPDVRAKIIAPPSLSAGSSAVVIVEMTLGENWHTNSHTPAEKFLIPTEVGLTTSQGTLSAVRYPRQIERRFAFSDKPMMVYEGTVRFEADLSLPKEAVGKVSIAGNLSFQACNDRQCFPPAKIPLEGSIVVSSADSAPRR